MVRCTCTPVPCLHCSAHSGRSTNVYHICEAMYVISRSIVLVAAWLTTVLVLRAQGNAPGRLHVGFGSATSLLRVESSQMRSFEEAAVVRKQRYLASTVTWPVEIGVGVSSMMSMGLYGEFGRFRDTSAFTANRFSVVGFQPRVHVVNEDWFTWMVSARLGWCQLQVDRQVAQVIIQERYQGLQASLGTGVAFYVIDEVGLQLHCHLQSNRMALRELNVDGFVVNIDRGSDVHRLWGMALQASLAFRF